MINVVCGIGSTGRICTDIANQLNLYGHQVKIAYGRGKVPKEYQKYAKKVGSNFSVLLHCLLARFLDNAGFGSKIATRRFIKWVDEYKPDVVHIHNIHGYYINIKILFEYLKKTKVRVVWTMHDMWAVTGHTPYCDIIDCKKWIDGCEKCPLLCEYPKSLLDRSRHNWKGKKDLFCSVTNMIIVTPSKWLEDVVRKSFLCEYQTRVIYNGIKQESFCRTESHFRYRYGLENCFIILGVASVFNDKKGFSDFLKIAEQLSIDDRIVMVGLSGRQIKKLPSNIIGIKNTANIDELVQLYSTADVFLNLTYCESFGQVNVESALCETPVIAYDVGGCKESVGNSGCLVKKGDISAVLDKINEYKGKTFANNIDRDLVDIKSTVKKYLDVYGLK